jgi:hypothetical protein
MSNAELRLKNEEVEIRRTNESCISTNKVSFLGSRLLLLFNAELRLKNEEVEIRRTNVSRISTKKSRFLVLVSCI